MDDLLTPEDLVQRIPGTTKDYWAQLRFQGTGPTFLKPSPRKVLYRWIDVSEWLASKEQTRTDRVSA